MEFNNLYNNKISLIKLFSLLDFSSVSKIILAEFINKKSNEFENIRPFFNDIKNLIDKHNSDERQIFKEILANESLPSNHNLFLEAIIDEKNKRTKTSSPSDKLCFILSQESLTKIDSSLNPELDRGSSSQDRDISNFFKILMSYYSDFLLSIQSA